MELVSLDVVFEWGINKFGLTIAHYPLPVVFVCGLWRSTVYSTFMFLFQIQKISQLCYIMASRRGMLTEFWIFFMALWPISRNCANGNRENYLFDFGCYFCFMFFFVFGYIWKPNRKRSGKWSRLRLVKWAPTVELTTPTVTLTAFCTHNLCNKHKLKRFFLSCFVYPLFASTTHSQLSTLAKRKC